MINIFLLFILILFWILSSLYNSILLKIVFIVAWFVLFYITIKNINGVIKWKKNYK